MTDYSRQNFAVPLRLQAFTLIELLIVVAIIGILASVLGSRYVQALERADIAACQQNLRAVHTALLGYRLDYNRFPPADGMADNVPHPDQTAYGCGPSANGYWSGVPLLLAKENYCSEDSLYCPSLKRSHSHSISAYPSCGNSQYAGKQVPQWRFLRFAYNNAAIDAGGTAGAEQDIETQWGPATWLVRCMHLDVGQFDPTRSVPFPFRFLDREDSSIWYGEFEMNVHGHIRERKVVRVDRR